MSMGLSISPFIFPSEKPSFYNQRGGFGMSLLTSIIMITSFSVEISV